VNIDLWSDLVCPWCWIGEHRLDRALLNLGLRDKVTLRFHAYELGPRQQSREPILEHLAHKYHVSLDEARQMTQRVQDLGAELGLDIDPEKQFTAPTFDAHRLVAARQAQGDARALVDALHRAHFSQGRDLGDLSVLAAVAAETGMDRAEAQRVLQTGAYAQEVEEDLRRAQAYEIRGVPFFVFDMKLALNGAQPVDVFEKALKQALNL
jgi:predicted DsbA family dithiol-disulfide isomerase